MGPIIFSIFSLYRYLGWVCFFLKIICVIKGQEFSFLFFEGGCFDSRFLFVLFWGVIMIYGFLLWFYHDSFGVLYRL